MNNLHSSDGNEVILRKEAYQHILHQHRDHLTYDDYHSLKKLSKHKKFDSEKWDNRLQSNLDKFQSRLASLPEIAINSDLPIAEHSTEIIQALHHHQLIVVAGETGSGKSTQLPQIALAAGFGRFGLIGHTQPRRLAARAVAQRIADEMQEPLGELVGYSVRFDDKTKPETLIKVMTDGILLQEMSHDPLLLKYDVLIIDEAHERSVNIDFILGYLSTLLVKRPELRVIITSATVNTETIVTYFQRTLGDIPVIEVAGRTFPIEIRYRPLFGHNQSHILDDNPDSTMRDAAQQDYSNPIEALYSAIEELRTEDHKKKLLPGHILIFFPSEQDILQAREKLKGRFPHEEVLVLFSRLSSEEQNLIFSPAKKSRLILATNVAETSITVPGIRYVIDTGTARIARYSQRTRVMRLPIEPISQASAKQRSGRCGRTEPGIAIRLYSEADFSARPLYTDPEILRSNISTVILHMAKLNFAPIIDFPFIDPPSESTLHEALQTLIDLGAIPAKSTIHDSHLVLSEYGKILVKLSVDPRLGRMLIAGNELDALEETLIIVSALAIGDIRYRPKDMKDNSDKIAHTPFTDKESDFMFYVNIHRHLTEIRRNSTYKIYRNTINDLWLNQRKVKEWFDLYRQLSQYTHDLGWKKSENQANVRTIHQALLTGMTNNVGMREINAGKSQKNAFADRTYLGVKGLRFHIGHGSHLAKKPPAWIMAFEFIETGRTVAYLCGIIEPEWLETLVTHQLKKNYTNVHWSKDHEAILAEEKVLYKGLPIINQRLIHYAKINPQLAYEMFIQNALVEKQWERSYQFMHINDKIGQYHSSLEAKLRKFFDIDFHKTLHSFYSTIVPNHLMDGRSFDYWYRSLESPEQLHLPLSEILSADLPADIDLHYPDKWKQGKLEFDLEYIWSFADDSDGVHVKISKKILGFVSPAGFDWHIPGYRQHLIQAIFENIPKEVRHHLQPVIKNVQTFLELYPPRSQPLTTALSTFVRTHFPQLNTFEWERIFTEIIKTKLPQWLKIKFDILTHDTRMIETTSDNLRYLQKIYRVKELPVSIYKEMSLTSISQFPQYEDSHTIQLDTHTVEVFHGLYVNEGKIFLASFPSVQVAHSYHVKAVEHLLFLELQQQDKRMLEFHSNSPLWSRTATNTNAAMMLKTYPNITELLQHIILIALQQFIKKHISVKEKIKQSDQSDPDVTTSGKKMTAPLRTQDEIQELWDSLQSELPDIAHTHAQYIAEAIAQWNYVSTLVEPYLDTSTRLGVIARDIVHLKEELIGHNFLLRTPFHILPRLGIYAKAQAQRFKELINNPTEATWQKDNMRMSQIDTVTKLFHQIVPKPELRYMHPVHYMIEEFRISLFAQNLGTMESVSEKKITAALRK